MKHIILSFSHGNGPYLISTNIAVKVHKKLEQKIMNDVKNPKNLTRYNYYFNDNKKISIKNAEFVFYEIVFGKEIQNPDFGKNLEHQIDYSIRYNRSEDPVLQNAIIKEQKHAEEIFLKAWGNFTNY